VTASAQPRIVLLSQAPIGADAGETATIEEGLRTLGYTKGMSISIDYRSATPARIGFPLRPRAVALNQQ